jgi:hypothetical protein
MSAPQDPEAKLAVPGSNTGLGSVTPSDLSFTDEKERGHVHSDDEDETAHEELQRVESSQYPTSFKLIGILLGVILSIFLVALDMVSCLNKSY